MRKMIFLILIVLLLSFSLFPNFGGYEISKLDGAGAILNVDKNNSIELIKERLFFTLGQRVKLRGIFHFYNSSSKEKQITFGFPIESFWEVLWDRESGDYYPKEIYNSIKVRIRINGTPVKNVREKLSLRTDNFRQVELLSKEDMKSKPVPYIMKKAGELNAKPGLPILVWKLFNQKIQTKKSVKIEISFVTPWAFVDEFWSDNMYTDGIRFFNYITSTASTWKNGKIKDFKAVVRFPGDAESRVDLFPAPGYWERRGKGHFIFNKKDFSPAYNDHLHFVWISKYSLNIPGKINHFSLDDYSEEEQKRKLKINDICWDNRYYEDYQWRFLFDGTAATAWSGRAEVLNNAEYKISRINGKIGERTYKKVFPYKEWYSKLKYVFKYPKDPEKISIISGFARDIKTYKNNSRPKKIILFLGEGIKQEINLKDTMEKQVFELKKAPKGLRFKILSVYPGDKYDDVCISEIDIL